MLTLYQPLFEQLPERLKKKTARPTPSKKRSAPASTPSQPSSVPLPTRPGLQEEVQMRRSEEIVRPLAGALRREARLPPNRTSSFDALGLQQSALAGQTFGGNLQNILPMEMSMGGTGPEAGSTHRHAQGYRQGQQPAAVSSLNTLGAMMFPPGDPFAYPNQPLLDPAGHHPDRPSSHATPGQSQDAMQYYMSSIYDDIEGQLMGPIPPYLMQQGRSQHSLDPTGQMYATSSMLTAHPHAQRNHSQMGQHPQQQTQQHHRDMMEDILGEHNFQGDWNDMLGHAGGYQ